MFAPLFVVSFLAAAVPPRPAPPPGPRVLIYVDMDGSSGVARPQQVLYPNPEYFASRRFITADVNAAIRGLKAGGAGEIVVTDAHGSGNTESPDVIIAKMDPRGTFLFRDAEYDPYLEAMDSSFQAIVCVGMHARAASAGFMAHTVTLEPVYTVNSKRITESALIALSAARFGIPSSGPRRRQSRSWGPSLHTPWRRSTGSRAVSRTSPRRTWRASCPAAPGSIR